MKTKIIEVTNGFNWGKFLIGEFDTEWELRTQIDTPEDAGPVRDTPLLAQLGWGKGYYLVLDLQTGEGFICNPVGMPSADLRKHAIWVCPMYEPFLKWFYQQPLGDIASLPSIVTLTEEEAPSAMFGYRRPGPEGS